MKNFFKKNTIVLIQYPFSDLSSSKVRPALIIRDQVDQDIIVLLVTSSFGVGSRDLELKDEFLTGFKFPIRSFVRLEKICTLQSSLVKKTLGSLQADFFEKIRKKLSKFLTEK